MTIFDYRARTKDGRVTKGAVEAPSEKAAEEILREQGLIVLSFAERERTGALAVPLRFFNRASREEVTIFARQLSVMVGATVPLVKALRILVKQQEKVSFKIIISDVAEKIDGGAKLSEALAKYPRVFDKFFIYMVRSGETTGKLDEVLEYLADQKEKNLFLMKKIRGALAYPAFVIVALIVVGIIMMSYVLPKLLDVLSSDGADLPVTTQILISVSSFFQHWWWLVVLVIIILVVLYFVFRKTDVGAKQIDTLKLKIPIAGDLFQKIYLARFAQSFSTLLKSGVPIAQSLQIVSDVVGNKLYKSLILQTIKEVEMGNSISTVFVGNKDIPLMLNQMMIVGEETGRLDQVLEKVGDFYSKEVDTSVDTMVSLIEPIVIVIIGIGIGILVAGVLLPIYSLSTTL